MKGLTEEHRVMLHKLSGHEGVGVSTRHLAREAFGYHAPARWATSRMQTLARRGLVEQHPDNAERWRLLPAGRAALAEHPIHTAARNGAGMSRVEGRREGQLPPSFPPKGLSRIEAARHVGVSTTTWDDMVRDGRMPQPKVIGARVLWDRHKVEAFFDALPDRDLNPAEAVDSFADWR